MVVISENREIVQALHGMGVLRVATEFQKSGQITRLVYDFKAFDPKHPFAEIVALRFKAKIERLTFNVLFNATRADEGLVEAVFNQFRRAGIPELGEDEKRFQVMMLGGVLVDQKESEAYWNLLKMNYPAAELTRYRLNRKVLLAASSPRSQAPRYSQARIKGKEGVSVVQAAFLTEGEGLLPEATSNPRLP